MPTATSSALRRPTGPRPLSRPMATLRFSDGTHAITASQILIGQSISPKSRPQTLQIDATPPTASIASVAPNPRTSGVAQMNIVFNEPVYGLNLADLQLTRNGGANLLTGSQTISTSDNITWTLSNLGTITSPLGSYALNLTLAGGVITDVAGNQDRTAISNGFTVDATSNSVISLVSTSDTGISNSDGITNLNNGSVGSELQFQVTNTVVGATVTVFANGNPIGTATASGTTTLVTTNGTTTLIDGTYTVVATQTLPAQQASVTPTALTIQVDTTPPTLTQFGSQLRLVFDEPVYGLDLTDLQLTRNGGANLLTSSQSISTSDHITWTLNNLSPLLGTAGSYTLSLTLAGTPVTDAAGNVDQTTESTLFNTSAVRSAALSTTIPVSTAASKGLPAAAWTTRRLTPQRRRTCPAVVRPGLPISVPS